MPFRPPSVIPADVEFELEQIAKTELHIDTLKSRKCDALDFHDVGVMCLREALHKAYLLGKQSR